MIDYKEMFVQMVDQNNELQKTIHEMIPKLGNTTYSQNNTQNFNINVFLNEQCKDALNIMDFVNSLQLQLKDLENTGKLGFVEGTSKIIIDGLKELEINKRPIHCSDIQKEILYVKDNDTWEQDDTKNKMKMAIDQINKANMKQIPKWITENPTYAEDEEYMKIISNIMKMDGENDKEKINYYLEKIIDFDPDYLITTSSSNRFKSLSENCIILKYESDDIKVLTRNPFYKDKNFIRLSIYEFNNLKKCLIK